MTRGYNTPEFNISSAQEIAIMSEGTEGFRRSSRLIGPAKIAQPVLNESLIPRSEAAREGVRADQNTIGDIGMAQIPRPPADVRPLAGEGPHDQAINNSQRTKAVPHDNTPTKVPDQARTFIVEPNRPTYMGKVRSYASEMPNLSVVSSQEVRFPSAGKLVCYDFDIGRKKPKYKQTMKHWNSQTVMNDFRQAVLEDISPSTYLRLALVEDLSPDLMEVVGSVLNMSPELFEEHLRNAGYQSDEDKDQPGTWGLNASPKGYASISWHRPVLPTIQLTNFRSSLVSRKGLQASCVSKCGDWHPVELTTNIFRRNWDLSSEPESQPPKLQKAFPTAWEEKLTFWTKQVDRCRVGN